MEDEIMKLLFDDLTLDYMQYIIKDLTQALSWTVTALHR